MNDMTKSAVLRVNKPVLATEENDNKWKVLLGFFALVSGACLLWMIHSLNSVSQYLSDFNQAVVLPSVVFLLGLVCAVYALAQLFKQRGSSERDLIETETLRRRQEAEIESERARQIQQENERNQMAILRLLDELGDLAEGDLTVNATESATVAERSVAIAYNGAEVVQRSIEGMNVIRNQI